MLVSRRCQASCRTLNKAHSFKTIFITKSIVLDVKVRGVASRSVPLSAWLAAFRSTESHFWHHATPPRYELNCHVPHKTSRMENVVEVRGEHLELPRQIAMALVPAVSAAVP